MGLAICEVITDLHDQELTKHGHTSFPIACYDDDLTVADVSWHWHEEWELVLVTEGCLRFEMENTNVLIDSGDGIFINSKAMHAVRLSAPGKQVVGRLHSVVFHPRLIGGSMDSVYWQELVQPLLNNEATRFLLLKKDIPWQKDVLDHFHTAWAAIVDEQDDFENFSRYLLSKAIRSIVKNADFSVSNLSAQELAKIVRIRTMMEFIELHFMEDLSVDQIAESASVSSSACLRSFHEMLHTTPMQYVIDLRLTKAANLLKTTPRAAKDIAFDCGFSDTSYFTKVFRLKYHATPGQYRK